MKKMKRQLLLEWGDKIFIALVFIAGMYVLGSTIGKFL
jgi:hypothetical protein